jgi:hypothetical protein
MAGCDTKRAFFFASNVGFSGLLGIALKGNDGSIRRVETQGVWKSFDSRNLRPANRHIMRPVTSPVVSRRNRATPSESAWFWASAGD